MNVSSAVGDLVVHQESWTFEPGMKPEGNQTVVVCVVVCVAVRVLVAACSWNDW